MSSSIVKRNQMQMQRINRKSDRGTGTHGKNTVLVSIVDFRCDFLFEFLKLIPRQCAREQLRTPLHQIPHQRLHLAKIRLLTNLRSVKNDHCLVSR